MKRGVVFSIEEFAIHDGPGIRTTVFLKGCPLRCVWCHNPEGISLEPQVMLKKGKQVMSGISITTDQLAEVILKNKDIYAYNNGGVTFTGGEPLMQSDFILELLQQLPEVHKAIETSGYAPTSVFQKVVSLTDLILFDVKHMDPVLHKKYTGKDNRLILQNLKYLCDSRKEFIIRIPLIPGVNDTKENMEAVRDFIKDASGLKRVELLRYHKTAGAKYEWIGQEYNPPFDVTGTPCIHNVFEKYNIETLVV